MDANQALSDAFRDNGIFFPALRHEAGEADSFAVETNVFVSPQGIEVDVPPDDSPGTRIPWSKIRDVIIEGPDTVETRVTASRLLFLGVLALAFPKAEETTVFVDIVTVSGKTYEYAISDEGAAEVRNWFRPYRKLMAGPAGGASAKDVTARLKVLEELLASGAVTQDEYDEKRGEILDLV